MINIAQKPSFKRIYKKLQKNQRIEVNKAIRAITKDPLLRVEKSGDLSSIFVYKFNCINQQFLLAFQWEENYRLLLLVGVHENFYKRLKH
jgi:mRNA-degrading endonuclease YafQ of YafQ-DinJ toxin-antitoxin module